MSNDFVLAQAVSGYLLSWWKALLILPPFVAWAWLVSAQLDKDARYYHLNYHLWNGIHLGAGVAALAAMLFVPIFWIGWPLGILILVGPVLLYWKMRNQQVPEGKQFHLTSLNLAAAVASRRQSKAAKSAVIQFTDAAGSTRIPPAKDEPLFPVHMLAEDLIGPAISARASRLELVVGTNGGSVSQIIDGVRYKRETVPTDISLRLIDYLKEICGLDVSDRRRRQAGKCQVRGPAGHTEIDLVTKGSSTGQVVTLDFDRASRLDKPFDALGLLLPQLEALRVFEQPHERHGVILIGAPPGHGLTTTAYSMLSRHDAYTTNVKSLEREIMVQLMGVDQVEWDSANPDIDYATQLQSILRRDPDIVLVAELRDSETAQKAAEPGMQGPLIYVQQQLGSVEEQIRDWVKRVGDLKEATKGLRAVMNQRLLRRVCQNCRQPYTPSAEQLKKLNIPAKRVQQLYRAGGKVQVKNKIENCPICNGTGYFGQTAAFQVMIIDNETRKLLAAGDLQGARAHARRNNMMWLQEAALAKVVSGDTTLEEVVRVTSPQTPGAASPAPPQPASAG